jgi:hypothetical protein
VKLWKVEGDQLGSLKRFYLGTALTTCWHPNSVGNLLASRRITQ